MTDGGKRWIGFAATAGVFLLLVYLPVDSPRFAHAIGEALHLAQGYARENVLLCLVPAFFIAGAISVFVTRDSLVRHLGPGTNKALAYGMASVAGTLLAVCSCTVLPLFAGIYRMGAGLGPATTFLYSGPAINVLAIILTARILGFELGVVRAVCAVGFSVAIGLTMSLIFRTEPASAIPATAERTTDGRPLWKTAILFATMAAILVIGNWARSGDIRAIFLCCPGGLSTYRVEGRVIDRSATELRIIDSRGQERLIPLGQLWSVEPTDPDSVRDAVYRFRWLVVAALAAALAAMVAGWLSAGERREWVVQSWDLARQVLPLLLAGVLAAGFLLGRPAHEGMVPGRYIEMMTGRSPTPLLGWMSEHAGEASAERVRSFVTAAWPLMTNLFAAVVGSLTYFATLTEVPIVQGLLGSGMDKGPALALLLAGPALSLPNMLVIRSLLGTAKTCVYVGLVVLTAAVSGLVYGAVG